MKAFKPIIIEFKVSKKTAQEKECTDDELLALAETAITQINEKKYFVGYEDVYMDLFGAKFADHEFTKIGIGAQGKRCRVLMGDGF